MQHETSHFTTADGLSLFERTWRPDVGSGGTVVIVHGIHEHSGRYAYVSSRLMEAGFTVRAFDLRGHGQSDGERGFVESFNEYVSDLHHFLSRVAQEAPDRPLFVMGHSMGGLVVSAMVVKHGLAGIAGTLLSSPAIVIPTAALLQRVAPIVSKWMPRLRTTHTDVTTLSRDPLVGRAYKEDEFTITTGVRARLGFEILRTAEHVRGRADAFSGPLYIFHGTEDLLTSRDGSHWLAENAASDDVTLRIWDGLRHETMNEPERDEVIDEVCAWIEARIAGT